jgi:hypothetical protein
MQNRMITLFATAMAALMVVSVSWAASTNDPRIQQRMQNQENRIDQGVQSGALTPRETGRLEAEQAKIKQDEARMKADGNLTARERAKLTREQDRASRDVYRLKHNNRTAN